MASGDYVKTVYIDGAAPGINATNLNKTENKVKELDTNIVGSVLYAYKNLGGSL